MATVNEPIGTKEEVIVVVREERPMEKGVPPVDMQCAAANAKGNRHKEEIFWDEELRVWSSLCEKHHKQNEKARHNKAKKVTLYVS